MVGLIHPVPNDLQMCPKCMKGARKREAGKPVKAGVNWFVCDESSLSNQLLSSPQRKLLDVLPPVSVVRTYGAQDLVLGVERTSMVICQPCRDDAFLATAKREFKPTRSCTTEVEEPEGSRRGEPVVSRRGDPEGSQRGVPEDSERGRQENSIVSHGEVQAADQAVSEVASVIEVRCELVLDGGQVLSGGPPWSRHQGLLIWSSKPGRYERRRCVKY